MTVADTHRLPTCAEARRIAKYRPRESAADAITAMAGIIRTHYGDEVAARRLRNLAFVVVHGGTMPSRRELRRIAGWETR